MAIGAVDFETQVVKSSIRACKLSTNDCHSIMANLSQGKCEHGQHGLTFFQEPVHKEYGTSKQQDPRPSQSGMEYDPETSL